MKKFLSISLITSSLLFGFEFVDAEKDIKRIMPESIDNGVVLSYYDSIKDAKDGVVNISTEKKIKSPMGNFKGSFGDPLFDQIFNEFFGQMVPKDRVERSLGSGVVVSEDGYIITNNHVIDGAETIIVTLPNDKKEYKAKLIGKDPKSDLAVIKIDISNLKPLKMADSSNLREGDIVFAIGNPFGVGETVTKGIISALNKSGIGINDYENFIQTDASINPGNSGGALVDSRGALIGINTAIISKSGSSSGVGFAIPSNTVKHIASSLINNGKVERGYLGVTLTDLSSDMQPFYKTTEGALILGVEKGSPADLAGIKRSDLIIAINGEKIGNSNDLKNKIGSITPNSIIKVTYERDKRVLTTDLKLSKLNDDVTLGGQNSLIDGLSVENLDNNLKQKFKIDERINGVLVVNVEPNSKAFEFGFFVGDVIVQIENMEITNIETLTNTLKQFKGAKKRVYVNRRGIPKILVID